MASLQLKLLNASGQLLYADATIVSINTTSSAPTIKIVIQTSDGNFTSQATYTTLADAQTAIEALKLAITTVDLTSF